MFRERSCPKSTWAQSSSLSKLPSSSNGADNPNRQRKPCPSCMQFGHMGQSHQSCPENPKNKQVLTNSIANPSDDLLSDAQSSTDVSYEVENEGSAVDSSKADDNVTANAVEAQAINNEVALPLTTKYSKIWIHVRPGFSR